MQLDELENMLKQQLNPSQRLIIALKTLPYYAEKAKERQLSGVSVKDTTKGKAAKHVAKLAMASVRTIERAITFLEENPQYETSIMDGTMTFDDARREVRKQRQKQHKPQCIIQAAITASYVYGVLRGEVLIYIGKGTGDRVYTSMQEHNGDSFVIYAEGLTDIEAYEEEKRYIRVALSLQAPLENRAVYLSE